ncbi:MAG: hypothetical protein VW516_02290, partial [Rhodospirillaceae bacterium]
ALQTTTTGALPRPTWYTENLRGAASRMHAFYKMVSLVRGANMVRKEIGLDEVHVPAEDPQISMVPIAD